VGGLCFSWLAANVQFQRLYEVGHFSLFYRLSINRRLSVSKSTAVKGVLGILE
jgi:hypothetical protein